MRHVWPLLRVTLIQTWRGNLERFSGTRSRTGLLLLPLLALAFIPLFVMITLMYVGLYRGLELFGQPELMLTLALTAGQLACLVFGVLYVLSVFYFSKDLKYLIPLPLRPSEIVVAKLTAVMLNEYITMAPLVLPALAVYGVLADVGPLYIPFALLIFLMLPVVPLVLAALFSLVLMRVTNLRRNRDLLRVFGALIGVALALLIQFSSRFQQNGVDPAEIQRLIQEQQPLVEGIARWVVTSVWGTQALQAGSPALGIPGFLLFTAAVSAALAALVLGAERLFFGGLLGGDESRASGRQVTRSALARQTARVRSPLAALLLREVRLLNRNPTFLLSAVVVPLLLPIIAIIPLAGADGPLQGIDIARWADRPWTPVAVLGTLFFLNAASVVPSSAISREGRWFWISRSLPVPPRLQIHAKQLHSLLFSLLNLAVVVGAMAWFGLATPRNLAVALVGGPLTGALTGYTGLLVDVMRPHLTWTDPQQAMKGNTNSLLAMLVNLGVTLATALVAVLLFHLARPAFLPGLLVVLALETWGLGRMVGALADLRYPQYEQ
ncbi:MAG: hypothetical protein AB2385_12150 [Symbiobacterium sp.]|uniref:putative ABC transporter permease subunit n=1 Tax=Symbiobacterium sp. TaxID=1971213 RepID=UPI00346455FF